MNPRWHFGLGVVLLVCAVVAAQNDAIPAPADQPQGAVSTVHLMQRSPHSPIAKIKQRVRRDFRDAPGDYDLADEPFELYLPPPDDSGEPWGLLVWISPFETGGMPEAYRPILDRHRLIGVSPLDAGNERNLAHRLGLALDAAHNVMAQYDIAPDRVYVAGFSGGGRCSSWLAMNWPDVFPGAIPTCGCDFYRPMKVPDQPGKFWRATFHAPLAPQLLAARTRSRFVLLTGEQDTNRLQTHTIFTQGFQRDGFRYATYMEVPGLGHAPAPPEWFEKAIIELDKPLPLLRGDSPIQSPDPQQRAAAKLDAARQTLESDLPAGYRELVGIAKRFADTDAGREADELAQQIMADPDKRQIILEAQKTDQAEQLLALARNFLASDRPDLARPRLETLVRDYNDTPQADTARNLLATIPQ